MLLWYLLLAYNALVLVIYGLDKWKAGRNAWRTPERTLLWLAALGGGVGALLAMRLFRHKSRKRAFRFGLPVMATLQIALLLFAAYRGWLALPGQ